MYPIILALHSLVRWLVLISLLFSLYKSYYGWSTGKSYTRFDYLVRYWTVFIAHTQLILGLWLYFISPIIHYFLHNFKDAVDMREYRFFGMEHSVIMLTAMVLITIGSAKAKRKQSDREKHKTVAVWFTVGLLIILIAIPWRFSPIVSRPYLRSF
jgi:hypothetical protein